MKKKSIIPTLSFLLLCTITSFGQKKPAAPIFTADSLASGNYKDVLTSFFQLAFENFTGPQKELTFSSNPFAIMMKANPDLAVDTNYVRYKALRNLNFNFTAKLDSNYKFNGFSSGVNYAIINKRDYTVFKEFNTLVENKNREFLTLNLQVDIARSALPDTDSSLKRRLKEQWDKLKEKNTSFTFDKADKDVREKILQLIQANNLSAMDLLIRSNKKLNIRKAIDEGYDEVKNAFKNRLLWTVGVTDTTYKDQLLFSNIVFSTKLLRGITNPACNHGLEIDIKGAFNIADDSIRTGRDLKRSILAVEGGLNYVWRSKKTDLSFFEFKMSAAYNHIFNGVYVKERKEMFTLNGTFRVRIIDDIWIPVAFKYDPDKGNVFGFLSVKANFTALKKVLASKAGS